jgi:hypothetical protein
VTQSDVERIPFKLSWSSWVVEHKFMKSNPELYSWCVNMTEEFEERLFELEASDQLNAALVLKALLGGICRPISQSSQSDSTASTGGEEMDFKSRTKEIIPKELISTVVPMRSKTLVDKVHADGVLPSNLVEASNTLQSTSSLLQQLVNNKVPEGPLTTSIISEVIDSSKTIPVPNLNEIATHPTEIIKFKSGISGSVNENVAMKMKGPSVFTTSNPAGGLPKRHNKGTRPRGCPCCDPDNMDNIIDQMLFLETPP